MKPTFEQWKRVVERNVVAIAGIGCDDIGDCDYRSWYEDEVDPAEAAQMALEAADFPFDEDSIYDYTDSSDRE